MKLSKVLAGVAIAAGLGLAAPASALSFITVDSITMDARAYNPDPAFVRGTTFTDSASYVTEWDAILAAQPTAPQGYGDQSLGAWNGSQNNSGVFGANTNLAYHDQVTFDVTGSGTATFTMGIDFGDGGTLLVDGTELQTQTRDLWWQGNAGGIDNNAGTLTGSIFLTPGPHTLNVYGFEDCCDGGTEGGFKTADGGFATFNTDAGPIAFAVSEPAVWALMMVGFAALGATLRSRRKTVRAVA